MNIVYLFFDPVFPFHELRMQKEEENKSNTVSRLSDEVSGFMSLADLQVAQDLHLPFPRSEQLSSTLNSAKTRM